MMSVLSNANNLIACTVPEEVVQKLMDAMSDYPITFELDCRTHDYIKILYSGTYIGDIESYLPNQVDAGSVSDQFYSITMNSIRYPTYASPWREYLLRLPYMIDFANKFDTNYMVTIVPNIFDGNSPSMTCKIMAVTPEDKLDVEFQQMVDSMLDECREFVNFLDCATGGIQHIRSEISTNDEYLQSLVDPILAASQIKAAKQDLTIEVLSDIMDGIMSNKVIK